MKFLIFAGTTEGKLVWDYLHGNGSETTVFVATEYGASVMPGIDVKDIKIGRLDLGGMKEIFMATKSDGCAVVDATHPYAAEVSKNLKEACLTTSVEYFRIIRASTLNGGYKIFDDTASAVDYLSLNEGNVLLTTGSKDLEIFTRVKNYGERLYPRILPAVGAVEKCVEMGFKHKNIICMQGPFSYEMNVAMINQIGAKYIVTKDTGRAGGFDEKIKAAETANIETLVIKRPEDETGVSFDEFKDILAERFGIVRETINENIGSDLVNKRFPLFFNMKGKQVLIVGGGKVATRRVKTLLEFSAGITVISKTASDFISKSAENGKIKLKLAAINEKDINSDYFIVVAATDDDKLNEKVGIWARNCDVLSNVASNRTLSDFFFPAIFTSSGIVGGVVSETGGEHRKTAAIAEKLRRFLNPNI